MTAEPDERYAIIRVGEILIGIAIAHLSEVFPMSEQCRLPHSSALLTGAIDLRGRPIPLLNLPLVTGIDTETNEQRLGVVIESDDQLLAFCVQEIVGITTIANDKHEKLSEAEAAEDKLFVSVFGYEGGFVSVIDIHRLFAIPGIVTANRPDVSQKQAQGRSPQMMTFEAGSSLFAVPAIEVFAAVPKQVIAETAIASGDCLGEIAHHGRRIPVICPVGTFGLGLRQKKIMSEVVVLRFPDDLVLGFAVDAIHDIRTYPISRTAQIPDWQNPQNLLGHIIVGDSEEQIFAVNVDGLHASAPILQIASLSKPEDKPEEDTSQSENKSANVIYERERYLIADVNGRVAIPLLQVACILDPPKTVTPTDRIARGVKGFFNRLGQSVTLLDLKENLGAEPLQDGAGQILLTGEKDSQIGFLVERVISIEVSQWREKIKDDAIPNTTMVQLGSGDAVVVLPYFDLTKTISQVTGTAPQAAA